MDIVKIKDVTTQIRGVSYKHENLSEISKEGYVELFRANNISDYGILLENTQFVEKKCISEKQFLIENDILIAASSGSKHIVGKSSQIKYNIENTSFGAFCKVLRPKSNINPIYLGYYFQSPNYRRIISSLSEGANINNIKNENLDNLEIPLPPLVTQKAIAEKLDKADALRKKDKELLKQYDELAQSIFIDMFGDPVQNEKGWEVEKLNNLCKIGSSRRIFLEEYTDSGVPFYRTKEIVNLSKGEDIITELFISRERYYEIKNSNTIPKKGDILVSAVGTIGVMWVVDDREFYFKDGNLIWLRDISINNLFLQYSLSLKLKQFKYKMAEGAAYSALTIEKLNNFELLVPPITLQNQFAEKIKNIEAQKELVKKQAEASENLFQALLQESFSFT